MQSEPAETIREAARGLPPAELPAYAPMLAAYHRAHGPELRAMVADLPLSPGDRVLDLACGDGVYSCWLAERVGPAGQVVGVDLAPAYLALARAEAARSPYGDRVSFRLADAYALPFADDSFDLAWCAQSMFSLPDPLGALRELRRVTRPGGAVAVFENDLLHPMVLPWPADLELTVRAAHLASLEAQNPNPLAVGRDLCVLFAEAGLRDCRLSPYSTARHAPLEEDEAAFLAWHLGDLRERALPHLEPEAQAAFEALTDPASERYMPRRPDFVVTYLDLVAVGIKGHGPTVAGAAPC